MLDADSGPAEAAPADDLRATIAAAIEASTPAAEPGMGHNGGPEMEQEAAAARDERGRFAPREPKAEDAGETPPAATETQDEPPPAESASKPDARLAPPDGWPSDARLAWDRLPRAAQEALRADLDAGRISLGKPPQGEAAPDPVREVVKTYEPLISQYGTTPEQYVRQLFEAARALDENPAEALKWLARSRGVDLATLVPQTQGAQASQGYVDPSVAQLQQEITQLKGYLTQQERAQHDARLAEQQRAIDAFAQEKGSDGTPLRPHFNEVRVTMGRLMQTGEATDMATAYDMAVWARPDLRQRILEQERKAEAAKREAEQRKAAEEAKKRAVSVKPNPSVAAGNGPADSLRAELERALRGG